MNDKKRTIILTYNSAFVFFLSSLLLMFVLICFVGCEEETKVEYTADNNTNIANIISVLKEKYHLANVSENEISLRGTKTNKDSYVDSGSVSFKLFVDSNEWENGFQIAEYVMKRISAMCSNDSINTISCYIYFNVDGCYVQHRISYSYNKNHPDYLTLSITEYNSDSLKDTYDFFKEQNGLEPYPIRENNGLKYITPVFELSSDIVGLWRCKANLKIAKDYSVDELIKVGEFAHAFMKTALLEHMLKHDIVLSRHDTIDYDITIESEKYYVTGENTDNSDTLVWEHKEKE